MSNKQPHRLTAEQRVQFWSLFTTALVGLFSFWLGIAIQDDISTKNARETQKLARYQLVEAIYPKYIHYIDTGGFVFYDMLRCATLTEEEARTVLSGYLSANKRDLIEAMTNSVNFMSDNRYYFGATSQQHICANNLAILFGLRLLEPHSPLPTLLEQSTDQKTVIEKELQNPYYLRDLLSYPDKVRAALMKRFGLLSDYTSPDLVAYHFLLQPYIDNFELFSAELTPEEDIHSHLWQHLLMLIVCVAIGLLICRLLLTRLFHAQTA